MATNDIIKSDPTLINLAWVAIAIPFITGIILILLRGYELKKSADQPDYKLSEKVTGWFGVAGLLGSLVVSITIAISYFSKYLSFEGDHAHASNVQGDFAFLPLSGVKEHAFKWGILLDPLSVLMMVLLAIIATVIHIYSIEYMHADSGYTRFFGTLNFFTGSMMGFVLASNLFMGFIFWELLGFSSYLLIGYYWTKKSAASAGRKAFLYNKVGDVSFLIGIALVWKTTLDATGVAATLDYAMLKHHISEGHIAFSEFIIPGLLIFGGAIGKSAQVPLLGWLPEAMEGPTPVSSLLHSSTMVKAGLFLTARIFFMIYELDEIVVMLDPNVSSITIAWVGTLTALAGALMAVTATDIKKVLAFSTISQLGYIALALGAGGLGPSFLHLISHATFKSLLFLCAGAVIHAVHSQEMEDMGGLKKKMPYTYWTMLIGLVALAGTPLSSGFWSKDAVLLSMEHSHIPGHLILYYIGLITATITAFYSTKLLLRTFHGKARYDKDHVHPTKAGMEMRIPLIILATMVVIESVWFALDPIYTIFAGNHLHGWLAFEHTLAGLLGAEAPSFEIVGGLLSILFWGAGVFLAYLIYGSAQWDFLLENSAIQSIAKVIEKRFYLDWAIYGFVDNVIMPIGDLFVISDKEVIDGVIIDTVIRDGALETATIFDATDRKVVDGAVKALDQLARDIGSQFRKIQIGQTPWYARIMVLGLGLVLLAFNIGIFTGMIA